LESFLAFWNVPRPMKKEDLMRLAIEVTRAGIRAGQGPVGCVIELDGVIIAREHNRVRESLDVSAHAEIVALRAAAAATGSARIPGAVVATTCEPCPMCAAALWFADVSVVYYGASIEDLEAEGFRQIRLAAADVFKLAGASIELEGGILADECRKLLRKPAP
jgi:tRNA(Arg) A34 adenosine deaminase TadA